jgi:hypothetical protein
MFALSTVVGTPLVAPARAAKAVRSTRTVAMAKAAPKKAAPKKKVRGGKKKTSRPTAQRRDGVWVGVRQGGGEWQYFWGCG